MPFVFAPFFLNLLSIFFRIPFYDSVGGFQYKDAGAWASCTKALALTGEFLPGSGEWCLRRPLFPEIASYLFRFGNSVPFVSLLLSIFFGAALVSLNKALKKILPASGNLVICLITLAYWFIYCCNQILTESLALTLCLYGLVYLLKAWVEKRLVCVYLSIAFLGISQQIRPGNLFLPLVPISLIPLLKVSHKSYSFIAGIGLFSTPYIFTALVKEMLGNPNYANAGNAWASLYGLANNNSTWQSAYSVPGIPSGATDSQISNVIKSATLDLISSNILAVPVSIGKNLFSMLTSFFPFFSPISLPFSILCVLLNLLFILFFSLKFASLVKSNLVSKPEITVLVFILATSLLSYSIAWKSEPSRALMPTIAWLFFALMFIVQGDFKLLNAGLFHEPNRVKNPFHVFIQPVLPALILVTSVYSASFTSHHLGSKELRFRENCKVNEFSFIEKSVTKTDVTEVNSLSIFSWSKDLQKLMGGQLLQGLAWSNGEVISINAFVSQTQPDFALAESCYKFSIDGKYLGGFSDSGVRQIERLD